MLINTRFEDIECARAEQHKDKLYLYDEHGDIMFIFDRSCKIIGVEDGEIIVIEAPEPTFEEMMMEMTVNQEYEITLLKLGIEE